LSRSIASIVLLGVALRAEIIDRIAASVEYRVITTSEVERQIRVAAFEDGLKPDLSTARRQATLQTMIDQALIQKDLENSHYPLPDPAELNPAIDQFKKEHFPSDAEYQRVLAEYGITEQDLRDLLLWQRTLLSFIQVRFETGIQITDQEISDYFEKTIRPAAEAAHPGQAVTLDDYREQIQKTLEGQQVDRQMETWLSGARRRARILIHEEALQ